MTQTEFELGGKKKRNKDFIHAVSPEISLLTLSSSRLTFAWRQTLAARSGQGLKINSEEGLDRCKQVDWGLG